MRSPTKLIDGDVPHTVDVDIWQCKPQAFEWKFDKSERYEGTVYFEAMSMDGREMVCNGFAYMPALPRILDTLNALIAIRTGCWEKEVEDDED